MQDCTSLQTDNHASTPPLSFFTGQMPFLPPNQQRQSTEGMEITPLMKIWNSFCLLRYSNMTILNNGLITPHSTHVEIFSSMIDNSKQD